MNQKEETPKKRLQQSEAAQEISRAIELKQWQIEGSEKWLGQIKKEISKAMQHDGSRMVESVGYYMELYKEELAKKKELEAALRQLEEIKNLAF